MRRESRTKYAILGMLALDLGVFHRRTHVVRAREAAIWTTVWVVSRSAS